jgi:hypothetical protein
MGIFSWLLEGNERSNSHVGHLNTSYIVSNTGYSYLLTYVLTYLLTYLLTPADILSDILSDIPPDTR